MLGNQTVPTGAKVDHENGPYVCDKTKNFTKEYNMATNNCDQLNSNSSKTDTYSISQQLFTALLFAVVCLTWGTTWIGIKIAVQTVPPLTSAGIRFLISFPLFLAFAFVKKEPILFPKNKRLFFWAIVFFYFTFPYFLINYGEQYVSSGLSALIFSSMPIFTIIFSVILVNEKVDITQVVGIMIGFVSLLLILMLQDIGFGYKDMSGIIAIFIATIMHALCYIFTKKQGENISVVTFNVLPIGIGGLLLFTVGWFVENPNFTQISNESIFALLYLGVVASIGGFITYFYLLKRLNPVALSFVFIIFPVVSVVIGNWFDEKILSPSFSVLFGFLLFGFALTKIPPGRLESLKSNFVNILR